MSLGEQATLLASKWPLTKEERILATEAKQVELGTSLRSVQSCARAPAGFPQRCRVGLERKPEIRPWSTAALQKTS